MTPEAHAKLVEYAQRKGLKMSIIMETFIEMGVKHDIYEDNWIDSLKLEVERVKEHAEAGSSCVALAISEDGEKKRDYRCVWFREDKPPQVRKLGSTKSRKDAACLACGKTGEVVAKLKARDHRIHELEAELGAHVTKKLKVPKCNRGAVLNHDKEDQLIMTNCFRHRGEPVSVEKFCRIQARGLPCMFFAEIVVGVEGKR